MEPTQSPPSNPPLRLPVENKENQSPANAKEAPLHDSLPKDVGFQKIYRLALEQFNLGKIAFEEGRGTESFIFAKVKGRVRVFQEKNIIGEGYSSVVTAIFDLQKKKLFVAKEAKSVPYASELIRQEYEILEKVTQGGLAILGISKKPKTIYEPEANSKIVKYIMRYQGDRLESKAFHKLPAHYKLEAIRQLLHGLAYLESIGCAHGDIKEDNCYCLVDNSDPDAPDLSCVIGDFGGAEFLSVTSPPSWGTSTKGYYPPSYHTAFVKLNNLYKQLTGAKNLLDPIKDAKKTEEVSLNLSRIIYEMNALRIMRDRYALALIIHRIIRDCSGEIGIEKTTKLSALTAEWMVDLQKDPNPKSLSGYIIKPNIDALPIFEAFQSLIFEESTPSPS